MSQVSLNTNAVSRTDLVARYGDPSTRRTEATTPGRSTDRVEVSEAARQAAEDIRPVRLALVQRVREQIAAGTYETDDKVAIAAHEMTKALRGQG